jgi:hypothetical protein
MNPPLIDTIPTGNREKLIDGYTPAGGTSTALAAELSNTSLVIL